MAKQHQPAAWPHDPVHLDDRRLIVGMAFKPRVQTTLSKLAAPNGNAWASATSSAAATPSSRARLWAMASIAG